MDIKDFLHGFHKWSLTDEGRGWRKRFILFATPKPTDKPDVFTVRARDSASLYYVSRFRCGEPWTTDSQDMFRRRGKVEFELLSIVRESLIG